MRTDAHDNEDWRCAGKAAMRADPLMSGSPLIDFARSLSSLDSAYALDLRAIIVKTLDQVTP